MKIRSVAGIIASFSLFWASALNAEAGSESGAAFSVETSAWSLMNLAPDSPDFYQLSLGCRLDPRNVVFLNGITWKYPAPLGIPYGPSFESPDEAYPGYVRAFGLGLGYQRFIWKGLFASLYATPFLQNFYSSDDRTLGSGFQLFLQLQAGYQMNFFKGRLFLKPAVSFNYWPVNTGFPDDFREKEKNWPDYFLFEPHLNIGVSF